MKQIYLKLVYSNKEFIQYCKLLSENYQEDFHAGCIITLISISNITKPGISLLPTFYAKLYIIVQKQQYHFR